MNWLEQSQNPGDKVIDWAGGAITTIVTNAQTIFGYVIVIILVLIAIWWLWTGYNIFKDAKKRFTFKNKIWFYLILLLGLILGPIGRIVYNIIRPSQSKDEIDFINVEHKFYHNQASKVADCLNCGAYVLEGHTYCTNCGTQNRFKCKKCGNLTDYDDLFCFNCGLDFGKRREEIIAQVKSKKLNESQLVKKNLENQSNQSNQSKKKNRNKNQNRKQVNQNLSQKNTVKNNLGLQNIQVKTKNVLNNLSTRSKDFLKKAKNKASSLKK